MHWFKMWVEAGHDEKLEVLTDREHRIWFKLLCRAAGESTPGVISGMPEEVLLGICGVKIRNAPVTPVKRGVTALQALHTLEVLQKLRIISFTFDPKTGYDITFINFLKRNSRKPSDQPNRVKERVYRSRNAKKRPCNAPVTPVKRGVTPIDTDTDIRERESGQTLTTQTDPALKEAVNLYLTLRGVPTMPSADFRPFMNLVDLYGATVLLEAEREILRNHPEMKGAVRSPSYIARGLEHGPARREAAATGPPAPYNPVPGVEETRRLIDDIKRKQREAGVLPDAGGDTEPGGGASGPRLHDH